MTRVEEKQKEFASLPDHSLKQLYGMYQWLNFPGAILSGMYVSTLLDLVKEEMKTRIQNGSEKENNQNG